MALPKPWTGTAPPFTPVPLDEFTPTPLSKPKSKWRHIPSHRRNLPVRCDGCQRTFMAFSPGIYGKPCACGGHLRPASQL